MQSPEFRSFDSQKCKNYACNKSEKSKTYILCFQIVIKSFTTNCRTKKATYPIIIYLYVF